MSKRRPSASAADSSPSHEPGAGSEAETTGNTGAPPTDPGRGAGRAASKARRPLLSAVAALSSTAQAVADEARSARRIRRLRRGGSLQALSKPARALCDKAYEGLDPSRLADYHVHVVGTGMAEGGAFVHPGAQSVRDPRRYLRFALFRRAFGVRDKSEVDREFQRRLLDRARAYPSPPLHGLLAFDRFHLRDGTPDLSRTEFYVSNGFVFRLAAAHPDLFAPVMSVHPYRPDAVEALERWSAEGGRVVKWLPNVMGIDPSDPALDPYYRTMRDLDLALLSHGGTEHAVEAGDARQRLGNPQLLRRALENGVKVIVAHCAAAGSLPDLDDARRRRTPCFSLFLGMMDEPRWEGLLFGEISAIAVANRGTGPLRTVLERTDLHGRLVNGSDYPFPAIRVAVSMRSLSRAGFLEGPEERRALEEIRAVSPLLFDFVLKRTVRHPRTGARLPADIFFEHSDLPLRARGARSEQAGAHDSGASE